MACHSTVSCLLPFLPCSHSYPGLPWTRCSMLTWFSLPGKPFSTPGPMCEVNFWDSVQMSLSLSFSVVIPPTLPKKNPFPSIFPQHLHTLHPLLSHSVASLFVSWVRLSWWNVNSTTTSLCLNPFTYGIQQSFLHCLARRRQVIYVGKM